MSETDFDALIMEGVFVNTGRAQNGQPIKFFFRKGGDAAAHDIRKARETYKKGAAEGIF